MKMQVHVSCYSRLKNLSLFNFHVCHSDNKLSSDDCKHLLLPSQVDIQLLRDPGGSACLALRRNHTDPKKKKNFLLKF